MQKREI